VEKKKKRISGFIIPLSSKKGRDTMFVMLLILSIFLSIVLARFLFQPQQQELHEAVRGHPASTPAISSPAGQSTVSATALGYPATDGHIYWTGDFETGDTSQWNGVHAGGNWGNSSMEVVTAPVRWGKYAGKFTVEKGSPALSRAELSASQAQTGGYSGQQWYYSWSTYVPSNPNATSPWGYWADITQWMDLYHQCSPPLWIALHSGPPLSYSLQSDILDNKNRCQSIGPHHEWNLGTFKYDEWNDFTLHVKWSENPNVGFVEMWRNGKKVVPFTHMRTLDTSGGVYMEQALYHPGSGGTHVLYQDGTRRHDAYGGVAVVPLA
jgi:Polysaccharide lyase